MILTLVDGVAMASIRLGVAREFKPCQQIYLPRKPVSFRYRPENSPASILIRRAGNDGRKLTVA
jgi:hypothetical protein